EITARLSGCEFGVYLQQQNIFFFFFFLVNQSLLGSLLSILATCCASVSSLASLSASLFSSLVSRRSNPLSVSTSAACSKGRCLCHSDFSTLRTVWSPKLLM